ncbi:leucine--tRNA ligase [archaeon]|jgi:leucyl-tRNA synthetase|nr:leucine--tRNA ligase [archaeon]
MDFHKIEKKWQKKWEDEKIFEVKESKKDKYYVLEMFPYPSGSGLHMGHAFNYTIGDILTRFKRMQGFNVMYPMGYDSFGLPAENAAIKNKAHPKKFTEDAIKNYISQQKSLGLSYDWSKMIKTSSPEYYKWDQWIFSKMFEKGLAYKKTSPVNWCPECNTVLANEQVHNGYCWRHEDTKVEIKKLNQWYLKITDYADELYDGLEKLKEWPDSIKKLQKNWIGKSFGTEINFEIEGEKWPIFTTRADTLFGVTFLVISAQHSKLFDIVSDEQKNKVSKFVSKLNSVSSEDIEKLEKEGIFTGSYATHPLTGEKIPVYAGNFVLAEYGSGMVMAVPAHDQRDYEFAKKYDIPIKIVISADGKRTKLDRAFTEQGILFDSGEFSGLNSFQAKQNITKYLTSKKLGKKTKNFRIRDWLISRQRFWGTPIPIIYCEDCGPVAVPEKDLPVELPTNIKFDSSENPLKKNKTFLEANCPKCGKKGRRETDTMDTFVNSSWYYLRYCDSGNDKKIFNKSKVNYWAPVDTYIGGKEHACMHLIYIRFYTKFLRDLGLLNFDEPAVRLFNQGMLHGEDGEKMSKSKGNVVLPESVSKEYGIDTARLFLISIASPDKDIDWDVKGIEGSSRFLNKVFEKVSSLKISKTSARLSSKLNKTIKEVSSDIEEFKYNLAVIKLRSLFDAIEEISKKDLESALKLLSPFCPHIAEELWSKIGGKGFISLAKWPKVDESKIDESFEKQDLMVSKLIEDINNISKIVPGKKKVFVYVLPNEKQDYLDNLESIKVRTSISDLTIYAVNDKDKKDPENKSKKVKPGRPGIHFE